MASMILSGTINGKQATAECIENTILGKEGNIVPVYVHKALVSEEFLKTLPTKSSGALLYGIFKLKYADQPVNKIEYIYLFKLDATPSSEYDTLFSVTVEITCEPSRDIQTVYLNRRDLTPYRVISSKSYQTGWCRSVADRMKFYEKFY